METRRVSQPVGASEIRNRSVFISYRRLDDVPPPESPSPESGFVRYLWQQLRWELNQLGVPDAILWRDRGQLAPGDEWSEVILTELRRADLFLAIVSRNYIRSTWCMREAQTMAQRVELLELNSRERRILRVDKHFVPDQDLPDPLRQVQAVRFYDNDPETQGENEFFWRGKVQRYDEYVRAVRELALAIYKRLEQLGISMQAQADTVPVPSAPANGRVIYVAKAANDLLEEYRTLVRELVQRGFRVVPDPECDLPSVGEEAVATVKNSLSEAGFSVHMLGIRRGFRPDGIDTDMVPLQLACAATEAQDRAEFYRLIWAPKVLPRSAEPVASPRDPLRVLEFFNKRIPSDQIDGDTATRFNEFVLQRLNKPQKRASAQVIELPIKNAVYVHCAPGDRDLALSVARVVKKLGYAPIVSPDPAEGCPEELIATQEKLVQRVRHTIVCWGLATRPKIISELSGTLLRNWRTRSPGSAKIIVLLGEPVSKAKAEVSELGIGLEADLIIDASGDEGLSDRIEQQLMMALRLNS